jgi:hypothetical protein
MMTQQWEFEDLARHLCGIGLDDETTDIEGALMDKFDVDFDQFTALMASVLPLCAMGKSGLTETVYRGFGYDGLWLVKEEVPQ